MLYDVVVVSRGEQQRTTVVDDFVTGTHMQSYMVLGTWTQKGYETIDAGPAMLEEYVERIESMGGTFDSNDFYLLTGDYDWAALVQLPSQEAAARLAHGYASTGRGRMHFQSIVAQGPGGYEEYAGSLG